MSLRHIPNNIILLSREIVLSIDLYNSGTTEFWTIKPFVAIDTCQAIDMITALQRHASELFHSVLKFK